MARYRLDIADERDDAALRQMLVEHPMPGRISLTLQREPSFFGAAEVDGRERQILIGRDMESGRVIGTGSRSFLDRFVNGTPTTIGYLSGLRLADAYRKQGLIARAFAQFRRLHQDNKTRLYLTTIAADNAHALATLTTARAGLPRYHPAGIFHTAALPIARNVRQEESPSCTIRAAVADDADAIIAFFRREGPRRQFFPCYETNDLVAERGLLRGLKSQDLLLAFVDNQLVGTLGLWNQQSFRQQIVASYGQPLRSLRPVHNLFARFHGLPALPAPGEPIRSAFAALLVIADDNVEVFRRLLAAGVAHAAEGSADYLLVGLHERDPLLPTLRQQRANWYATNLYLVCWDDGESLRQSLDERPPYLELGSL